MSENPVDVSDALFQDLRSHFSEPELVELVSWIAWENYRARFNRAFAVESEGFSGDAFCPMPL